MKDIPAYAILYLIIGTFVCGAFFYGTGQTDPTSAEYAGVLVLWPLFVVKYLCIGIYMVLSAGFGALL